MNIHKKKITKTLILIFILWTASGFQLRAQTRDVGITIHLRGVFESKISLLSLSSSGTFKPIKEVQGIKNGETIKLSVSGEYLPGEFVLRFDYKEKESDSPYPSEKYIFINDQDLELRANPKYCNNDDSARFQEGERENEAFVQFSNENGRQKEKLGLLQNFLMNYEDTGSKFYQQGIKEYEHRRQIFNNWLKTRFEQDKVLFVSSLYDFQYLPEISWRGTETDRVRSLIDHYFDGLDFNNPVLIRTSGLNKWMDTYVNLFGQQCTTTALRDSLLPIAGKKAIERARQGNPLVYGWMVDYFYRGFEANNIQSGMKILEPYLEDPTCLTSKRKEIARRLKGMETLVVGSIAPDIILKDSEGGEFELDQTPGPENYILLFFWSAVCSHCVETANMLYSWHQQTEIRQKIMVVTISLDETATELSAWEKKIPDLKGWKHLRAAGGVNSKVAGDYFVLATPIMVLIDTKTKVILALPITLAELMAAIK